MTSTVFISLITIWAVSSLCAAIHLHRTGPLSLVIMLSGWIVGDHPKSDLLDVCSPASDIVNAPLLVQLHGGGWVMGHKHIAGQPVVYWEVPGAQHAFDTFPFHRTSAAVEAIATFLTRVVSSRPAD